MRPIHHSPSSLGASQATFLSTITCPGASQLEATQLFVFGRPRQTGTGGAAGLGLTRKQHEILFALSGCSDVGFVLSRVRPQVRQR